MSSPFPAMAISHQSSKKDNIQDHLLFVRNVRHWLCPIDASPSTGHYDGDLGPYPTARGQGGKAG